MRKSIHLMPADTGHLPFRALPESAADGARRLKNFGLTEKRYEQLRAAIVKGAKEPATLQALREAAGAEAKELKGATAMMTRTAELVRVGDPNLRSNDLKYVAGDIADADPDEALEWLAGEYLRAFGPARAKDFTWWTGAGAKRAKAALDAHETEELDDGLLILSEDRKAFDKAKPVKNAVDLLPKWDCYEMGYAPDGRDRFAHPDVAARCYDQRGDGRPVILVDGEAAGTWEGGEPELFDKATPKQRKAIDQQIEAVKAFLAG
jgi:winged helix DNA-binding protein